MDQTAILDHQFLVAAYTITWMLQLGYLAYVGLRWRAVRKAEAERKQNAR